MQEYIDDAEGMDWLYTQHDVPRDMQCAIITGNADSPRKIEAWRVRNPHYQAPPDYEWEADDD